MYLVDNVLLKLCIELYQSRYKPSAINVNQETNFSDQYQTKVCNLINSECHTGTEA